MQAPSRSRTTVPRTLAAFSEAGEYLLRLSASDGAFSVHDDVKITVYPQPNAGLEVNAGADLQTVLGQSISLSGLVDDSLFPGPDPVSSTWSVVSGPGSANFGQCLIVEYDVQFSAAWTGF